MSSRVSTTNCCWARIARKMAKLQLLLHGMTVVSKMAAAIIHQCVVSFPIRPVILLETVRNVDVVAGTRKATTPHCHARQPSQGPRHGLPLRGVTISQTSAQFKPSLFGSLSSTVVYSSQIEENRKTLHNLSAGRSIAKSDSQKLDSQRRGSLSGGSRTWLCSSSSWSCPGAQAECP